MSEVPLTNPITFEHRACLTRFDEFQLKNPMTLETLGPSYYCRGTVEVAGHAEEGFFDKDGNIIAELTSNPWTPAELKEIEEMQNMYQSSFSCDPEDY